jgi:hypothetical protein
MKYLVSVALLFFAASSLAAADSPAAPNCVVADQRVLPGTSLDVDFPIVSANQARPIRRTIITNEPPVEPGELIPPEEGGGGSWEPGACNCKRRCPNANGNCKLSSDSAQQCKSSGAGTCESCQKDCGL